MLRRYALSDENLRYIYEEVYSRVSVIEGASTSKLRVVLTMDRLRDEMMRTLGTQRQWIPRDTPYTDDNAFTPIDRNTTEIREVNKYMIDSLTAAFGTPDPHYNFNSKKYEYADWGLDSSALVMDNRYDNVHYGDGKEVINYRIQQPTYINATKTYIASDDGIDCNLTYSDRKSNLHDTKSGYQSYRPEMSFLNNPFNRNTPYYQTEIDRISRNFGNRYYKTEDDDDMESPFNMVGGTLNPDRGEGTGPYYKGTPKWEGFTKSFKYVRDKNKYGMYPMRNIRNLADFYASSDDCGIGEKENIHRRAYDSYKRPIDVNVLNPPGLIGKTGNLPLPNSSRKKEVWNSLKYNEPYPGFQDQLYKFGYHGRQ